METVNYIMHKKISDWGTSWLFMSHDGHSFGRAYIYSDDQDNIILDWLSVDPEYRRHGRGLGMQLVREALGRRLGCTNSLLWVKRGSWMERWYTRRGYVYYSDHEDRKYVWMYKRLKD